MTARLYLITPPAIDPPVFADRLKAALDAGDVASLQLRLKDVSDDAICRAADMLRPVAQGRDVAFIMNDRPDLALDVGADGVHVGQDDASPALARRVLGAGAIVGLSTHAPAELDASVSEPVDYVSAGPVEATPTKLGRPGTGVTYVTYAVERARRPVFVTGGVNPETVSGLAAAGAKCFVVVRFLTESDDPRASARALRRAIEASTGGN